MLTRIPKNKTNKGWFKKGHKVSKKCIEATRKINTGKPAWNKGKKMSKKTCKKLRYISLNMPQSQKNKIKNTIKNLWQNPEYRKRMSKAHRKLKIGGKIKACGSYLIYQPNHPFADKSGYVREHRLAMEKKIGRYLKPSEIVHHINNNHFDNHPKNLKLFKNNSEHSRFHGYIKNNLIK